MKKEITATLNILEPYHVVFIDVWGVIHNGVHLFDNTIALLSELKNKGKKVILVTNSPKRVDALILDLEELGLNRSSFDFAVTSGELMYFDLLNRKKNHLSKIKDSLAVVDSAKITDTFFKGLNLNIIEDYTKSDILLLYRVDGLSNNEFQRLHDYILETRPLLICANADKYVFHAGEKRKRPGLIAYDYAEKGGEVYIYGKPDSRFFTAACLKLNKVSKKDVIMIGDNFETDIKGAIDFGIDSILLDGNFSRCIYNKKF